MSRVTPDKEQAQECISTKQLNYQGAALCKCIMPACLVQEMLRHDCHIVQKKASCEAPGCSAVDCNTRVAFISKVSVLFHWRKTSQFIDMQLYSERPAQALCNGFPLFKSEYPGRKITLEYFTVAGNISVSGFFNIKEEISRYPGSRPCYSLSSHWSQRWNSHRNKWSRFCDRSAAGFMWSAVELFLLLW